jgi:hypothetical protein
MKRLLLWGLVLAGPLVLLFFPDLRRAAVRKARLVLLLWAGAILLVGFSTGLGARRLEALGAADCVLAAAGIALVLGAFALVARDALRPR